MKQAFLSFIVLVSSACTITTSASDSGITDASTSDVSDAGFTDASTSDASDAGFTDAGIRTVRVYVSGESIERRNRWIEPPFQANGALNNRGSDNNSDDEYGWMVPFADRLRVLDMSLRITWVGTDHWLDSDDSPYDGTYPVEGPGATSAIPGTSIPTWLEQRRAELENKTYCYDLAFASRGGNDFRTDDDTVYKAQLKELVRLLASGSSCGTPLVAVTAHMPDDQRDAPYSSPAAADYLVQQKARFVTRVQSAVTELLTETPTARVVFVDMFTPFTVNQVTTAFPSETWTLGDGLDYAKIGRTTDRIHPRRLASIFAGEIVGNALYSSLP